MSEEVEVNIETLKVIYDAVLPIFYKLNSFLEDAIKENILVSEIDKTTLLETCACCSSLKIIFENYFETAEINDLIKLKIPKQEYLALISMSKTVEMATRMSIAGSGIWEH